MSAPPSLPPHVLARSFRATNGELGILPEDTKAFLAACERDGIPILGWELWIIDHRMGITNALIPALGQWSGVIPTRTRSLAIIGGSGGLEQTRREIAELDFERTVDQRWIEFVRFNFTTNNG